MEKRLYKSEDNKVLAGVCGGLGEYFGIDPVLIRLVYLLATVFSGVVPGVVGYLVAAAIVPQKPDTTYVSVEDVTTEV